MGIEKAFKSSMCTLKPSKLSSLTHTYKFYFIENNFYRLTTNVTYIIYTTHIPNRACILYNMYIIFMKIRNKNEEIFNTLNNEL